MRNLKKALDLSRTIAASIEGSRSFCLVMNHQYKTHQDFHLVPRDSLPCWGELRRYKSCDPECTQPEDSRPGDLYQPFPQGRPFGVSFKLASFPSKDTSRRDEMIGRLVKEGPWASNFSKDEFTITKDAMTFSAKSDRGLQLDSTVLVSFLFFLSNRMSDFFFESLQYLPLPEAVASAMYVTSTHYGVGGSNYHFANISPRRILEGDPQLLSGGTFGDRFDYSRKKVQDVFGAEVGKGLNVYNHFMVSRGGKPPLISIPAGARQYQGLTSCKDYCEEFSRYFMSVLQAETEKVAA